MYIYMRIYVYTYMYVYMYIYIYKLIYSHWYEYVSLVSYHTSNTQAIFYIGAAATSHHRIQLAQGCSPKNLTSHDGDLWTIMAGI